MTLTKSQQLASVQLEAALVRATESGLLDVLNDFTKSPDSINDVCDSLDSLLNILAMPA